MLREYIDRGGPVLTRWKRLIFGINRHRAWQIVKDCAEKAGLPKLVNPETGRIHNVSPHCLRSALLFMLSSRRYWRWVAYVTGTSGPSEHYYD